ncbi:MAG: biopolymer transporter ExbD [Gammaproteobacteria bacterium]|nr:biopolymer transporter ExbD [Gammaproteobacteria bacterium]MBT8150270.1 biopolymer transporter ExbD [Gammaproteobacteria bacterium]NND39170.1 biopolymer transporter ExbD [Pseudomonadales bacterium]NNL11826.1 biopolymer transporter ExbD [Pseudomonadales bacterium]NNM12495.1 biopolymer transporter ExbD [Pseudomonadales bacterium]
MSISGSPLRQQNLRNREEADLDITPFMNLMIVLVPVLLLSMVFTRITVIDLQLPASASGEQADLRKEQVEVVVRGDRLAVNFPAGMLLREVGKTAAGEPNYAELTLVLQELKRHLQAKQADRKNINMLVSDDTDYSQIIATMDAVRSYQAVVVTDVVDAELFPDIAFGDAPAATTSRAKRS